MNERTSAGRNPATLLSSSRTLLITTNLAHCIVTIEHRRLFLFINPSNLYLRYLVLSIRIFSQAVNLHMVAAMSYRHRYTSASSVHVKLITNSFMVPISNSPDLVKCQVNFSLCSPLNHGLFGPYKQLFGILWNISLFPHIFSDDLG